ncbi:MobA/MobL family protein [Caulobacter sp. AP07]|uniref:MobQ family relaxase n=1 Tax=Caulobacter sp. AP07 TaxID=1144304 RepID=UPI000271E331|nr:MobQ family relaxase [Caulobacter sp. AP07]EJL38462.1 MobA/MobL family protein [Caulobacter sp. AP07]
MAQFRLEVQAIKRVEGRSSVAASAYRSATRLHDERLEMLFDYSAKSGVVFSGIMAPDAAPDAFADRERLWNAAETADRRADSRVAREILISLPYEFSDEQRHGLVRAFIAESLVARGMIADYGIHSPDAHGDARNHHAHILVTTRHVGPEGFGLKARDWDNPDAVKALRLEWAQVQNLHLRQHLGPDAAQVSHLSLAAQGQGREPTIHLGPSASGMERRGEPSDRGDINRAIAGRNDERREGPARIREIEDGLAQALPRQAYPIDAVIREFQAIHQTMVRERSNWARDLSRLTAPSAPTARAIAGEVVGEAVAHRAEAKRRLARTEYRIEQGRARRSQLLRWIRDPARMIWAKHAELNALARARVADRLAEVRLSVRRDWLRSDAGRTYIAARLDPAKHAAEEARRAARTLERKIKRADKRIDNVARTRTKLMVARELGQATMVAPSQMRLGVGQAVREVDRRVVDAVQAHAPAAQKAALDKVLALMRGRAPGLGPER